MEDYFFLLTGNSKQVCSEAELVLLETSTESSLKSSEMAFGFSCWQMLDGTCLDNPIYIFHILCQKHPLIAMFLSFPIVYFSIQNAG